MSVLQVNYNVDAFSALLIWVVDNGIQSLVSSVIPCSLHCFSWPVAYATPVQLVCKSTELPGTMSNSLRVRGKSDYSRMLRWQSASWTNAAVTTKLVYAKKVRYW